MAGSKGRDPQTLLEEASLVLKHFKIRGTERRRPRGFFFGPLLLHTIGETLWELSLIALESFDIKSEVCLPMCAEERSRIT
ncbi:hypothetical protein CEXT_724061 [Caerostris extrusa]|uniref:Uncharacterized protein n=1 Tax=Caerostris extrusa TaxID=172846 RepID=A0AAV4QNJ5_CAEEX|nr:hypothetical protein CEXT_724061 [Caerostris extrusa]